MISRDTLRLSWRSWFSQNFVRVGPWWLQYVWTLVFCMAVAVGFTILGFLFYGNGKGAWRNLPGWWHWYQINLVISLCVGFSIHLLFEASARLIGVQRIRRFKNWQRGLFFSVVPITGVSIGWPLGILWAMDTEMRPWLSFERPNLLIGSALFSLMISALFYQFFAVKNRQIEAEKRASEAQLKLLQGQIEPHFLFNTLANVVGLMEADTPRAKLMLETFVDYLRASLGSLRQERHTLGDEISLIDAYLRILKIRMDDRLHYAIDVPEALRALPLPALTLQPLVENAIVHGLEPQIEGGSVRISARTEGEVMVLSVQDDGLGLPGTPRVASGRAGEGSVLGASLATGAGAGAALNNIRERLVQMHGDEASLSIVNTAPHGVLATLRLPAAPANAMMSPQ